MSSFVFGPQRFNNSMGRSVTGDSVGTIRYPNPFFDIAHTYEPSSIRTMLRWCRYYFLVNPLINAVCYKMAEYPVTDLQFETHNHALRTKWDRFYRKVLNFKKFLVEVGLDYHAYGNCFVSIHFPFRKYLKCENCGAEHEVSKVAYHFQSFKFRGECPKCGHRGEFKARDKYSKSHRDIRLIRWDPEQISIRHNEATGESLYYYTVPGRMINDLRLGKRHIIERTPQMFIEAVRKNKSILFKQGKLFHLKRPTIAQKDKGWGLPMILPVLKDTFYLQILRKAQEAIAIEHVVPMRVLFPQATTGTSDVYTSVNIGNWKRRIEQEVLRWRLDNNYIPVLPIPIGQQTLGGDGRALMLSQEYRVWSEQILAGMQVPQEFIFGGLSYSGSNVSLRMLENHFLDYKSDQLELAEWIMERVAAHLGWEQVDLRFKRFKMADDLQRSAFNLQLNQAGKLSDRSLMEDTDWDSTREAERINVEARELEQRQRRQALSQSQIQGEAQIQGLKYQLRGQKLIEEAQPAAPPPPADPQMAMQLGGVPGQASPQAMGEMGLAEGGQMIQQGMTPPMDAGMMMEEMAAAGPEGQMQSPISMNNVMPQQGNVALPGSLDLMAVVQRIASYLDGMADHEKMPYLEDLKSQNPEMHTLVMRALSTMAGAHQSSAAKPKPEQRAPRRGAEATTG